MSRESDVRQETVQLGQEMTTGRNNLEFSLERRSEKPAERLRSPADGDVFYSEQERWALTVLYECRNALYRLFPFLDAAFAGLSFRPQSASVFEKKIFSRMHCSKAKIAADGSCLYFVPESILEVYVSSPAALRRGILHMLLHCLYLHILPPAGCMSVLWDLACDLAVEMLIEREGLIELSVSHLSLTWKEEWTEKGIPGNGLSAWQNYLWLSKQSENINKQLSEDTAFDCHDLWYQKRSSSQEISLRDIWPRIFQYAGANQTGAIHGGGLLKSKIEEKVGEIPCSSSDYRQFLRRFAVPYEELELDTESFDYIYYTYGMEHYRNLPLLEPLEYTEGHKLQELVIAIDTSGSCSVDLVRRFLSETYAILSDTENFFRRMNVYVIQCDCVIQSVAHLSSREEWDQYCRMITISGRSDTDFTPVFSCVEKLRKEKKLQNLKALLYFTDGDGIYPDHAPDYETDFLFVKETPWMQRVPSWAGKLLIS